MEARDWLAGSVGAVDERGTLIHLPDPATALVFRTTRDGRSDLLVVGPRTRAHYHAGKDLPCCVTVRLRPGAARPVLGTPADALVDRVVPLGELWGAAGDRLAGQLSALDPDAVLARLETALLARLAARTPDEVARGELLRAATDAIAAGSVEPVPALARRFAVSERHLRSVFTAGVGLPPKRYARITRVRRVLARPAGSRWAQLAHAIGYYDQSHLTAEFRELMGASPAAFFAGRHPAGRPC